MKQKDREHRREKILDIIVRSYIDSAEPIGSKVVSDQMGLSSATIRNIMSDLEQRGFIRQPYTSAGRVPTEKGYRFYVNFLMQPEDISAEEKEQIELIYQLESKPLEDIIEESSRILSCLSSLATAVMFPRNKIIDYILEKKEEEKLLRTLKNLFHDYEDRLYFDGTHYILEQPEFRDLKEMSSLFKALDEKKTFLDIFKEDLDVDGTNVHIGSENKSSALKQCSIITSSYRIQGNAVGTIGIIGPTRMEYSKLVTMVNCLTKTMSDCLDKLV